MLLKYNKKKILYGGDESSQNQIQTFLSIVILGYFGIKIVYGLFFNFYPKKFYYRNIQITTNEETSTDSITEEITVNAYVPGMWNNEMTDFITLLGLSIIIYVYTNISGRDGNTQSGTNSPGSNYSSFNYSLSTSNYSTNSSQLQMLIRTIKLCYR